ncbi:hypothetical protein AU14_01115 [Marinobacter similis]|uniref:Uncharacterized protein n=1 Tax=Marinobacter similis TaxID=1420916 RepID=W5YLM8_9GAMM|nr:hypothetical protein AU14_01115 [Marinobacter similis]
MKTVQKLEKTVWVFWPKVFQTNVTARLEHFTAIKQTESGARTEVSEIGFKVIRCDDAISNIRMDDTDQPVLAGTDTSYCI